MAHFDFIITKLGKGWAANNYMNLLTRKDLVILMKKATISDFEIIPYKISIFQFQYIVWSNL